jgi:hypothetical protein
MASRLALGETSGGRARETIATEIEAALLRFGRSTIGTQRSATTAN